MGRRHRDARRRERPGRHPAAQASLYPTVTGLFGFIFQADAQHADHITVTYDPTFGYPASVYVDPKELVADEEMGFVLTDFKAIP